MKNKIKLSSEGKGICCLKCSGYFEHRIGSHSDDRGGDSDYPCYCNQNDCKNPDCECHNQKSLDKKKTKELDWKKEFSRKYYDIFAAWKKQGYVLDLENNLKDFIKQTLTQQRTELLEEILDENFCDLDGTYDYDGIAKDVIKLCKNK